MDMLIPLPPTSLPTYLRHRHRGVVSLCAHARVCLCGSSLCLCACICVSGSVSYLSLKSSSLWKNAINQVAIMISNVVSRVVSRVSHLGLRARDARAVATDLVTKYCFHVTGARAARTGMGVCRQWALRQGDAAFIISDVNSEESVPNAYPEDGEEGLLYDALTPLTSVTGSVSNIALEVCAGVDLCSLVRSLENSGVQVLVQPRAASATHPDVRYAVVASCVGGVRHTLLSRPPSDSPTATLPGFTFTPEWAHIQRPAGEDHLSHVDHVTLACAHGSSRDAMAWYTTHLGFQRTPINKADTEQGGFVLDGGGVGLKLRAIDLGVGAAQEERVFKMVLSESLPGHGPNQVDAFLETQGGPGVQHVGLHTADIARCARALSDSGVAFYSPPPAYYSHLSGVDFSGLEMDPLKSHGILIDSSEPYNDNNHTTTATTMSSQYLLQVFCLPLFGPDSCFLELISRHGNRGFGEGNIRALWRSVELSRTLSTSSVAASSSTTA
ncbi:4-hydroxyphenylpyruvate dioxygenase-like protein isoform X1 [Petromyzon marinus]|uniref:4-hydroxyphenylpyruvate dioxygenase-like protein isoform X1 n=1 Tax=Petromyzon marinus TaxID=7757 RepID=UPI003F71A5A2